MRVLYRRLLFAGLYVASLAVVAVVAAFLGRNFTGSGPIPTRSAFAGRLPGTPDGDWRRYQFFYATNRATDADNDPFNAEGRTLGRRRGGEISTGTFDVRISPYMPIEPWAWFDAKNMAWAGRGELSPDETVSRLREAVQASPHKSVLVVVWGFRDWFQSAAIKTAYTAYVLDINTPVLLFDWPGNQGDGRTGYLTARQASYESAPDLGRVLARVVRDAGAENVWLMGSSLGCQTICDAFACLEAQPELFKDRPKIDHVVLSAPDVAADAFDDKFAARIRSMSRHLTAYVTSNDRALLLSHWLTGDRRLGRTADVTIPPEDRTNEYEFEEALELLDLKAKGAGIVSTVDATPINRTRNLHHFFTDSPEFFDDLYRQLLQPDNMLSRRLHTVRAQQGTTYWILWSD
ncbi:MAG TPA: alpha/beta hydrolase [Gemmataceae bacterium]|jgi:esterase/lipase superfamily enzyme